MIPNIDMHEHMMLERRKLLQREAEQKRMLADLPHHSRLWHLMRRLGTLFVAIWTRMQQREQPDHPVGVYEHKTARLVERTGA